MVIELTKLGSSGELARLRVNLRKRADASKAGYGTYLRTANGRHAKVDLFQELADSLMYTVQDDGEIDAGDPRPDPNPDYAFAKEPAPVASGRRPVIDTVEDRLADARLMQSFEVQLENSGIANLPREAILIYLLLDTQRVIENQLAGAESERGRNE